MNKCPVCITGSMVLSGAHKFCSNCGFVKFEVNDDYIEASAKFLASLVSNTRFYRPDAYYNILEEHVEKHLPQLQAWLSSIANGHSELMQRIADTAKSHAINLVIDEEVHGYEEESNDIVCPCGKDEFQFTSVGRLVAKCCQTNYRFDTESNQYEPEFICDCSSLQYDFVDESNLVICSACQDRYVYDKLNDVFRKVNV